MQYVVLLLLFFSAVLFMRHSKVKKELEKLQQSIVARVTESTHQSVKEEMKNTCAKNIKKVDPSKVRQDIKEEAEQGIKQENRQEIKQETLPVSEAKSDSSRQALFQAGKFLTTDEVAVYLGISRDTVRRRIKKGEIRATKMTGPYGKQYFIPETEIMAALKNESTAKDTGNHKKNMNCNNDVNNENYVDKDYKKTAYQEDITAEVAEKEVRSLSQEEKLCVKLNNYAVSDTEKTQDPNTLSLVKINKALAVANEQKNKKDYQNINPDDAVWEARIEKVSQVSGEEMSDINPSSFLIDKHEKVQSLDIVISKGGFNKTSDSGEKI